MEKDRKVRSDCVNASNPYHVCAEYCSGGGHKPSSQARPRGGRSPAVQNGEKTNGGGGGAGERRHVDPPCPNASNPFHQCSDYCKGKTPGAAKKQIEVGRAVVAAYNGERSKEVGEGRHVDPSCVNASNPFHQCGEYCAQRTNRGGKAEYLFRPESIHIKKFRELANVLIKGQMHLGSPVEGGVL